MTSAPPSGDTRARILTEAERLFRHYGYSKTTVADIADACTMSSANVYRFFPSKSAIVEAICGVITSDLEAKLRKIAVSSAPASERLTQFIELLARYTTETYTQEKKVHEMVVVAMEENWGAIDRHLEITEEMIAGIVAGGIVSGEFKQQDPAQAAKCIHFALAGFSHPVLAAQCGGDPGTPTPAEMAAFILSALKV
ncbi:MAG: TetR/AcrR family transcriptional regulator [Rhodomicrobium sp.]